MCWEGVAYMQNIKLHVVGVPAVCMGYEIKDAGQCIGANLCVLLFMCVSLDLQVNGQSVRTAVCVFG